LLNGKIEPNNKVKNMFKSIQLNIDNPHFLVAQGKITKIINLKPDELVSMMEETAGTALYCDKKREAQKVIEKKETKLQEINELLSAEIEPQLDRLRQEKQQFMQYKQGEQQILSLNRKIKAYEFYQKQRILESKRERLLEMDERGKQLAGEIERLKRGAAEAQKVIAESQGQSHTSREFGELEQRFQEKLREVTYKVNAG